MVNTLICNVLKMDFFGWIILYTFALTKCIRVKSLKRNGFSS